MGLKGTRLLEIKCATQLPFDQVSRSEMNQGIIDRSEKLISIMLSPKRREEGLPTIFTKFTFLFPCCIYLFIYFLWYASGI